MKFAPTAKGKFVFRRVRRRAFCVRRTRLPEAERKSLGLQPGVGYDENELQRARFYRALAQLIAREARESKMAPLQRIGFDGRVPLIEFISERLPKSLRGQRNTSATPLDYLYFQARDPLAFWEWVAGRRFEYDWQRAHTDAPMTVSLDGLMLSKVQRPTAEERRRERIRPATFRPSVGRRVRSKPELGDSRLDALARIGRLQDEISKISFWLLEQVIGYERTLKQVGELLSEDQRYVGRRFREALWEAASFYKLGAPEEKRHG